MSANRNILLSCKGLCRRVDGHSLLDDIDFEVTAGTTTALFGPSGAGKSLLLRALAMLDPIQDGVIKWRDKPVKSGDIPWFRSECTYIHQRAALPEGTVESVLREPFAWACHQTKSFRPELVEELIVELGLDMRFLEKRTSDLSGGETQLVSILRVLILAPNVLLLDEPTSALDEHATGRFEAAIRRWRTDQRAVVFVSHELSQVRRLADQIVDLENGRITSRN